MTITVVKSQATIEVLHGSNFKRWNEICSINDLIFKCVSKEEKLKKEKSENVLFTIHSKPYFRKLFRKLRKVKSNALKKVEENKRQDSDQTKGVRGINASIKKDIKCFTYKKIGHMKRDCLKYKSWLSL